MSTKTKIDALWSDFEKFISQAYTSQDKTYSIDHTDALRDYQDDRHALADLLKRETANERQYRGYDTYHRDFSPQSAAKLILLNQVGTGALKSEAPSAIDFLIYRREAVEAGVLGWLCRKQITPEWRIRLAELDYAQLMKDSRSQAA